MRRRSFAGAFAAAALGRLPGMAAANDRVNVACIGTGWQGGNNVKSMLELADVRVTAVCDVDAAHLAEGRDTVNTKYGGRDCLATARIEEVMARREVDAVVMSLPDHWHGIASVLAAKSGKDIYGEKPIAHNFAEGRAICEAVERYGRVWQTGSWQRSVASFRRACELVRSGRIGKVRRVEVGLPGGHTDWDKRGHEARPVPPPQNLDYERWLGPAPAVPYCPARVHKTWRWCRETGGGMLMDWIGHHVDIAHWGLALDESGPTEVNAQGEFDPRHPVWNTASKFRVTATYPEGVVMLISGGYGDVRPGTKWIGDEGWIWVDRSGFETQPASAATSRPTVLLPASAGHHRQFIDCVRTRGQTLAPAATALRSTVPGYLGNISLLLRRPVRWDARRGCVVGDEEAQRMLGRPMRSPWTLDWSAS